MHPHGIDIGAIEQGLVGGRVIAFDPVDQLVLAEVFEPRLARLGLGLRLRPDAAGVRRGGLRDDRRV